MSRDNSEDAAAFQRMMRFGMIDMGILLISMAAGVSLDGLIAKRVGHKGYGVLLGAGIGNLVADVFAGLPEGLASGVGVGVGCAVPLAALAVPLLLKRPFGPGVRYALMGTSAASLVAAYGWGRVAHRAQHGHERESAAKKIQ